MILLTIKDKSYPIEFVYNLKGYFKSEFISLINKEKLENINDYIETLYNIKFDIYSACIESIETALINETDEKYDLIIDPNIKFQKIRLKLLIQLLNDGTLDLEPYPIFTEVLKKIISNLNTYYLLYELGIIL